MSIVVGMEMYWTPKDSCGRCGHEKMFDLNKIKLIIIYLNCFFYVIPSGNAGCNLFEHPTYMLTQVLNS